MRVIVASLTALAVLYFCDKDLNDCKLLEGLEGMLQAISHSMLH